MELSFSNFINQAIQNPIFLLISFLILGVIFVNGCIDKPNSIATCVSTRSITPRNALIMSTICNFLGIFIMTKISATVAETVFNIANFGDDNKVALIGLCAGMVAIVTWTALAWKLGLPTSQSHSLVAGVSGAAIAIFNGFEGININEWKKVFIGLFASVVLGFLCGFIITKIIEFIFKYKDRRRVTPWFKKSSVVSAAAMAFMDGAQDGQKFIGIFLLGVCLLSGNTSGQGFYIPAWLMVICASVMSLGTILGGSKIIKTIGTKIVKLEPYQGTSVDAAGALVLLISSVFGIPVSTSHTKVTTIMGVGASRRLSNVNWGKVKSLVLAWILTFPGCGLLGFGFAKLFIKLFV